MRTGNPSKAAIERNPEAYQNIPTYEASPPDGLGGPLGVRCFPEHLRAAGYYTSNRSKEDYQFKVPVTVWDDSSGRAHWKNRTDGQPFFAVFNFGVTHESGTFASRKPPAQVANPSAVPIPPYYPDTPTVRQDIARTYDNIAALDSQVGRLLDELRQADLLASTYIFFYSDHGVGLPRGKRCLYDSGTRVPLIVAGPGIEPGGVSDQLVSFIDFAPTVLSLASSPADARIQATLDAMPGVPFLADRPEPARAWVFGHADRMDSVLDRTRSVTDGRYKLILNFMPDRPHIYPVAYAENIPMTTDLQSMRPENATPEQWQIVARHKPPVEFYDTLTDPHEVVNLASESDHAERIARMKTALHEWMASTNDLGLIPEGEMVRTRLWPPDGLQPDSGQLSITTRGGERQNGFIDLMVTASDPSASIGYRFEESERWHLYTKPLRVPAHARVWLRAHRIGHVPTEEVWTIDTDD